MNDAPTQQPTRALLQHGQSIWLDQLRRDWIEDGTLADWIETYGLRGVTSNPSIFEEAVRSSEAYDAQIAALAQEGLDTREIYDRLTLDDIRSACDVFRGVWDHTSGADGYVSHEVSPELAYDTWATIREVRRLWTAVGRPNVMIKIPATNAGLAAIEKCLAEGININITLMFTLEQYDAVAEAYMSALETRFAAGHPVSGIASVASFFVSRIDTQVDALIDRRVEAVQGQESTEADELLALRGNAAVANATRAYNIFRRRFSSRRFSTLEIQGARRQRVLWASTSTKDPAYSDLKYVEELVASHTINTLPLSTLKIFADHGEVSGTLDVRSEWADQVVSRLGRLGIDLTDVGRQLVDEGVTKFAHSYDGVLDAVEARRTRASSER